MNTHKLVIFSTWLVALSLAACSSTEAEHRTLAVNVIGSVSVDPTRFSGYYIFENQQGEQVRRNVEGVGNFNDVFNGKRIVRVAVRRTSPSGFIGLTVTSNGDILFNSGMQNTDELIVYQAES